MGRRASETEFAGLTQNNTCSPTQERGNENITHSRPDAPASGCMKDARRPNNRARTRRKIADAFSRKCVGTRIMILQHQHKKKQQRHSRSGKK